MNLLQEIFPGRLQNRMRILEKYMPDIQEIRIRVNSPIIICMKGKEYSISHDGKMCGMLEQGIWMNTKDLEECVLQICRSSIYAYEEETRRGYITIVGGHRIGIAGQVVLEDRGRIKTIKNISFLNIRIAHEIINVAQKTLPYIYERGRIQNTLILSPPGFGKTTLLRDMIRQISNGNSYGAGRNCSVIDERSELAGAYQGVPQLDVGIRTDVLDGCPKSLGMMMVIRSMGPEVVAVDELGNDEDINALFSVVRSGCSILATIHGDTLESLGEKSFLSRVMDERVFKRYIVIQNSRHEIEIYNGEMEKC